MEIRRWNDQRREEEQKMEEIWERVEGSTSRKCRLSGTSLKFFFGPSDVEFVLY